eukprot:1782868-Pyramimonas_sp.AAC.1
MSTRWVIVNEEDEISPDEISPELRARLVAREVKRGKRTYLFAAAPPLKANAVLFSQLACQRVHAS